MIIDLTAINNFINDINRYRTEDVQFVISGQEINPREYIAGIENYNDRALYTNGGIWDYTRDLVTRLRNRGVLPIDN